MGIFSGILICTDLDGTLLKNDKSISARNLEAIEHFKANGGLFTIVTGRMPYFVKDICAAVRPNTAFGCINGGGIYDYNAQKYVKTVELRREALELVQSVYEALPEIGIQVNTFDKIYFSRENEAMRIFREQTGSPNITRDFDKVSEPIAKIVFGDTSNDNILALERLLLSHPRADEFGFVRSDDILYEILPKGSSKGGVLPEIAKNAGVDIKRVIAVGDYNNDVTMLRAAGLGIAVANATPEALGAADLVTVSNEDDAIAKIIEDVEKGTIKV